MSSELVTIGRFARLTRLSVKQLRHYDELGLLAPACTDAETGYRLYHRSQARTAATIALLRGLNVRLAVIGELLVAVDARAAALLQAERDRHAVELERAAQALAGLDAIARQGALPEVAVSVRSEPPRRLAAVRAITDSEQVGAVTAQLAQRLAELVRDPSLPFTGVFPIDLGEGFEVVLGVEAGEAPPGTEPVELAGSLVASAVHLGALDTIALSWWPLLAWVHERGVQPLGTVRERYLDERTTQLSVPLQQEPAP